jgi:Reverse transcriptase (RNA-dependent DNA polymerase)
MHILREKIQDNRFLRLIEGALKAGYCEEWTYHPSLSGSPQGGIVSPILSNIYMDRLDRFVQETLIPEHTRNQARKRHAEYHRLAAKVHQHRIKGDRERVKAFRREMQQYPSVNPNDEHYRKLRYCRYADDFLLGFAGPKTEAEEIKDRIATFLGTELKLTLSAEKTLITHASTGKARFLGYAIGIMTSPTKMKTDSYITDGVSRLQTNVLNGTCWPYCHGHTFPPSWSKACHPTRSGGVYDHHHRVYHGLILSG